MDSLEASVLSQKIRSIIRAFDKDLNLDEENSISPSAQDRQVIFSEYQKTKTKKDKEALASKHGMSLQSLYSLISQYRKSQKNGGNNK